MECVKNVLYSSQNAKNEGQLIHKNQVRKRILLSVGLRVWRIILVITWWAQKANVYINFQKNNVNFEIFCFHVTGYLNTKESFPICMFVVMASGNCELHTYFTFLQRILTSKHMKKFNIFLHNICRDVQISLFRSR